MAPCAEFSLLEKKTPRVSKVTCKSPVLETLTREGQWTATPNRAVRSELPRGSEVCYCTHESLHDPLTVLVPRHGTHVTPIRAYIRMRI